VKTVANGGVYYLKKSLIQLDEALRGFTGETDRGTKEIQQGLRKVASTMVCRNKAGDLAISRIRSVLGIDILK
jgi:hypothetical protein